VTKTIYRQNCTSLGDGVGDFEDHMSASTDGCGGPDCLAGQQHGVGFARGDASGFGETTIRGSVFGLGQFNGKSFGEAKGWGVGRGAVNGTGHDE
jgi:hypothetical protein